MAGGILTDLYISDEAFRQRCGWSADLVGDLESVKDNEDAISSMFYGVNLHSIIEMGSSGKFFKLFDDDFGGILVKGDKEFCIGLDLSRNGGNVNSLQAEDCLIGNY